MAFTWKGHKDIFKGQGIYFLTFVVKDRQPLLGVLKPISQLPWYGKLRDGSVGASTGESFSSNECSRQYNRDVKRPENKNGNTPQSRKQTCSMAAVSLTPFGLEVSQHLKELEANYAVKLCAKQLMPDHIHVVIWVKEDCKRSIRQIGNGFRIGVKRIANAHGLLQEDSGHILEVPFIRTLAHAGQLRSMIDYVHANPDNAWMRRQTPDLYSIRRNKERAGLCFDMMGKERLLNYPDRHVVALSRSLTEEQIADEVSRVLYLAERGTVTYTAAINAGEKAVARAVREAGYPLVVMLLEGFPPENSESAKYYHPNGVYHKVCGEGRLLLLSPSPGNYDNPKLIEQTELELQRKADEKGHHYSAIPHDSKRWRMIAGNIMLRMIASDNILLS